MRTAMNIMQKKSRRTEYFNPNDQRSRAEMCGQLVDLIERRESKSGDIVVLCIGTDRATGDALGPIAGTILSDRDTGFKIYGTLRHPVHALNLREHINRIYSESRSPTVIAVDASLGRQPDVGLVTLSDGPLLPGIGVNKRLPAIGDISITGIVNLSGKPGMSLLQSTRLYTVTRMAEYIATVLTCAGKAVC